MNLVIWMLFVHWIADFILQDDYTAITKSKNWIVLFNHSFIYFGVLAILGIGIYCLFVPLQIWRPSAVFFVNFPAHFVIDAITSRINAKLWAQGNRHWFFVTIGLDQFLHYAVLFSTL